MTLTKQNTWTKQNTKMTPNSNAIRRSKLPLIKYVRACVRACVRARDYFTGNDLDEKCTHRAYAFRKLLHSHFDHIPAIVGCKVATVSRLGRTAVLYVIGLNRRS